MAREDKKSKIKYMVKMAEALDACRLGRTEDFIRLLKSKPPAGLPVKPKRLRKTVENLSKIAVNHPSYGRLVKMDRAASIVSLVGLIVITFELFFSAQIEYWARIILVTAALGLVQASYVVKWYVAHRISSIYWENPQLLFERGAPLKEAVEKLIKEIKNEVSKGRGSPSDVKLSLYLNDYQGIKVVKEPGKLRGKYLVVPD